MTHFLVDELIIRPSLNRDDMPKIIHQSSATGMQAIPTTGIAMGIQYRELLVLK